MNTALSSSSYGEHRSLHSFPTRRSSDLRRERLGDRRRPRRGRRGRPRSLRFAPARASNEATRADANRKERGRRSEEHTSELQSQSKLVCRLLLEKKKKDVN